MKTYMLTMTLLLGSSLVFYSMSPYFSALGLVMVSMSSCFILSHLNMSFLAFMLLLVYMGGMLMVFIYSSALTKDRFPTVSKTKEMIILSFFLTTWIIYFFKNQKWENILLKKNLSSKISIEGASFLFTLPMAPFFLLAGYILFMTLLVMLNMSRGIENSTLRALN